MTDVVDHPFNVLSLCSGAGGLDLGLALAVPVARTVCWVEWDAYAGAVLAARMAEGALDSAPLWTDLRTFDGRPWRGVVDCLTAGFPCQPFSAAGKRRGTADARWLWPDIARIVREVEPGWVFLENVPGLVRHGLPVVVKDLDALGFVGAWGTLSAASVGASHQRNRLWILAHARRLGDNPLQSLEFTRSGDATGAGSVSANVAHTAPQRSTARVSGPQPRQEGQSGIVVHDCGEERGSELAYTDGVRRQSRECDDATRQSNASRSRQVGDPEGDGQSLDRRESIDGLRRDADGSGGAQSIVADAQCERRGRESDVATGDKCDRGDARWQEEACGDSECRDAMAHASGERSQAGHLAGRTGPTGGGDALSDRLPLFPPGPADYDGWREVLAIDPRLEPAICRSTHGLAHRADQLRVAGNGVVPVAAAVAFLRLLDRLGGIDASDS